MDVLIAAFQDQETYKAYLKDLTIPPHPSTMKSPEMNPTIKQKLSNKVKLAKEEMAEYKKFLTERQAHNQLMKECYSLWCDMLYKLSIANHLREEVSLPNTLQHKQNAHIFFSIKMLKSLGLSL